MIFTHIDRYNMFVTYCQCNFNSGLAEVEYRNRFPQALQPNKTLFRKLATELKNNGSFLKKKTRMNSVTDNVNKVNRVINYVRNKNAENLETSLREIQVACRINKTSARKILKKNSYRCYRAKKVHNLQAEDKPRRTTFCRWLLEKKRADPLISSKNFGPARQIFPIMDFLIVILITNGFLKIHTGIDHLGFKIVFQ